MFSPRQRAVRPASRSIVKGQALVLALALLFAGSLGLMFLFSAGQATTTKQRAINAADAAAYSAAIWRARAFNYQAYANRAIIAQEVAIAQAVTITAWSKYFETFVENLTTLIEIFFPAAIPALERVSAIIDGLQDGLEFAAELDVNLRGRETFGYKNMLASSQQLLHAAGGAMAMSAVAQEVVTQHHPQFSAFAITEDESLAGVRYQAFTRQYASDDDRRRLQRVVFDSLDRFVTDRSTDLRLPLPSGCFGTSSRSRWFLSLRKRGGTGMSSLERWEAADTLSVGNWVRRGTSCREQEMVPLAWGAAEASARNTGEITSNPGDVEDNAMALGLAEDDIVSFDGYSGMTRVRDLDYDALDNPRFPRSGVAVLVRTDAGSVRTAQGVGASAGRLAVPDDFRGGRIAALAAAEVYFRRPHDAPSRVEYASLYSPYWQVRLREPTDAERREALSHAQD